jgi:hypothetical protein
MTSSSGFSAADYLGIQIRSSRERSCSVAMVRSAGQAARLPGPLGGLTTLRFA